MSTTSFYQALQSAQSAGDCTLAVVLTGKTAGTQLLLCKGKPIWQSGTPEASALAAVQQCTATGFLELDGMRIFAERFGVVPQLVVCGGGYVAAAVVRIAKLLGLPVLAIEDRPEYAQRLRDAGAEDVRCQPFEEALDSINGSAETYFVVVTRAHTYDVVCLKKILQKSAAYVGMMGSRGRAALVRRQLKEAGIRESRVESLCAPIGLAIGAKTAEEIALSIMAQIVSVKNSRPQTEGFSAAILQAMKHASEHGRPAVLATIISRHGSTPREIGAKMLILPEKHTVGSVGGGIMEYQTILAAQEMLEGRAPAQQVVSFSADGKNDDAALAACGGSMELLLRMITEGETLG